MEQVLLVVQVIVTLALIVMVLIQRSDSDGFGLSGGSGGNILSGRATANLMTRTTAILAALFMSNALLLGVLAAHKNSGSIVETIEEQQKDEKGLPVVPAADASKPEKNTDAKPVAAKKEMKKEEAPSVPLAADAKDEPAQPVAEEVVKKPAKKAAPTADAFDPNAAEANE
jgi:preprotein translocase subunit SecG